MITLKVAIWNYINLKSSTKAKEVLKAFREKHKTVIYVQHIANNEGATFFLPDTLGVQIHDDVQPIANERVLQKHHSYSFSQKFCTTID